MIDLHQTKKKILYVVNDSWFFKSHRLPIAVSALASGYEVHLLAVQDYSTDSIKSQGIKFHRWHLAPRNTNVLLDIRGFFDLCYIVRKVRPDVLHLVTIKSVMYGGIVARLLKVPSVVFAISGRGYLYSNSDNKASLLMFVANKLYRYVLSHKNSAVIVQNRDDYNFFVDLDVTDRKAIVLIRGSGVDLQSFNDENISTRTGTPIVLFASRMIRDKGVQEFVDAAYRINRNGIVAEFILAGRVDLSNRRSVSKNWLKSLRREAGVQWVGHKEDIRDLISDSAIVVLPTMYGEGVPKILIEAAACGKPIVATNWPGCREIVTHEYNGLLVKPHDINDLVNGIKLLLGSPSKCKRYGQNGRILAEKYFSIQSVVEKTLVTYGKLVGGGM